MRTRVLSATAIYALSIGYAYAECGPQKCPGELRQPHGDSDGYSFVTTSRIYPQANVFVYETCVENTSDRDMDFNWFVPGPNTRVPSGFSCINPRPMLNHKNLDTYPGCLLYGNNWTRDRGNFFPHITDQSRIEDEIKYKHCEVSVSVTKGSIDDDDIMKQATLALQSGIETNLDVFLPSNPKEPTNTMAHVVAKVSLTLDPNDPKKYIHNIQLSANSFRDSKPVFGDILVRPEHNYISLYLDAIKLPSEVTFSTELEIPASPELRSVRFELSSQGILGATLFIPYLVSGP
jgi:hypothetical protein